MTCIQPASSFYTSCSEIRDKPILRVCACEKEGQTRGTLVWAPSGCFAPENEKTELATTHRAREDTGGGEDSRSLVGKEGMVLCDGGSEVSG